MTTLEKGDELLRRIGCLKRIIRVLTSMQSGEGVEAQLADINTPEQMILDMGGQVREVPYSKSKLRRLDTQLALDSAVQILDPEFVQDAIQHRDVTSEGNDNVTSKNQNDNDSD